MAMMEARFYETYYFCNIVRNVLHNQFNYMRNLDDFYGDEKIFFLIDPFKKYSAFHYFIEFIVESVFLEEISKFDFKRKIGSFEKNFLPIEHALEFYEIKALSFVSYLDSIGKSLGADVEEEAYDYISELSSNGVYEELLLQTVKEVFHVLFQNRHLLMIFNKMMAGVLECQIDLEPPEEQANLFSKNGSLIRKPIPKWVKKAVFYRDRGRCVICDKDLSGLINLENRENYDHIVPLAHKGLNDVSNIQLLCKECNQLEKKAGDAVTSHRYQSWYKYD